MGLIFMEIGFSDMSILTPIDANGTIKKLKIWKK